MNGSIKLKQRYDKQQKKESAEFKSDTPTIFEQDIFKMNELTTSINKKKYVKKKMQGVSTCLNYFASLWLLSRDLSRLFTRKTVIFEYTRRHMFVHKGRNNPNHSFISDDDANISRAIFNIYRDPLVKKI